MPTLASPFQSSKKITESVAAMKFMLYGDSENEPRREQVRPTAAHVRRLTATQVDRLCDALFETGVLAELVKRMQQHEFEVCRSFGCISVLIFGQARKDVAQIFNYVLRQQRDTAVAYVKRHPEILTTLVDG